MPDIFIFFFKIEALFFTERMTFQNKVAASWQRFVKNTTTFIFKKRGEWRGGPDFYLKLPTSKSLRFQRRQRSLQFQRQRWSHRFQRRRRSLRFSMTTKSPLNNDEVSAFQRLLRPWPRSGASPPSAAVKIRSDPFNVLQFKSNVWQNFTFSQGRQTTDVAKLAIQKARVEHFWAATLVFPLQIWIWVRNLLKWPLGGAYVVPCLLLCGTSGGQIEASFGVLSSKSIFLPLLISPHTSDVLHRAIQQILVPHNL